jgi:muramoyltetrapeptide carboxypeptidase
VAGPRYAPRLAGRILLIEEIGEAPYRIDRMLTQLRLAGMLRGVKGVMVGSLSGCRPLPGSAPSPSAREVVSSFFAPLGVPVVAGPRFGHTRAKLSIPLGFRVTLDADRGRIRFTP